MKILFPHIPKCAGSSIKSQISNQPKVVMDYTNHPTWQSEHERNFGRESQMKLKLVSCMEKMIGLCLAILAFINIPLLIGIWQLFFCEIL